MNRPELELPDLLKPFIGKEAMMYLAHPTELHRTVPGIGERLEEFVWKRGFAGVSPFGCGKYKYFEGGGRVPRQEVIKWTLYLQRYFGHSGYFAFSDGVMDEFGDRLVWDKERRMRVFLYDDDGMPFDPSWEEKYEMLKPKYGDLLAELRGKYHLVGVVASRAAGKTFLMEAATKHFSGLERVRNFTTRQPREPQDDHYYQFVSCDQFQAGIRNSRFLEWDEYGDKGSKELYGTSLDRIKNTLLSDNGIFAITPNGARKLWECRFEINVHFIVLKAPKEVLMENFRRRGIIDPAVQEAKLKEAETFDLPASIPHDTLNVTGKAEYDIPRFLDLLKILI